MKIRSDYVTNSSSASFIIEIALSSDEKEVKQAFCVSEEGGNNHEDDVCGGDIRLAVKPIEKENDIFIGKSSLSHCSSVQELCNMIFSNIEVMKGHFEEDCIFATEDSLEYPEYVAEAVYVTDDIDEADYIICKHPDNKESYSHDMSEKEVLWCFNRERYKEIWGESIFEEYTLSHVFPNKVRQLLWDCQKAGISLDNLSTLSIKRWMVGRGETALFAELDKGSDYAAKYDKAKNDDEKRTILDEFITYARSEGAIVAVSEGNEYRATLPNTVTDRQLTKMLLSSDFELKGDALRDYVRINLKIKRIECDNRIFTEYYPYK